MSTRVADRSGSAQMVSVAARPSMPGIRMSMTTTSGRCDAGEVDRLRAVGGLADDLQVLAGVDQHPEGAAQERLVVGEEDADGHGVACRAEACAPAARGCRGSVVTTSKPTSLPSLTRRSPPTAWARSRMPMMP